MKQQYTLGTFEKVLCHDGNERFFRYWSVGGFPATYRGSVQYFIPGSFPRKTKTVTGWAHNIGCGRYTFEADPALKNAGLLS